MVSSISSWWKFLSILYIVHYVQSALTKQVDLPIGSILGKEKVTVEGTRFLSFVEIPYAEPPIGTLRFQAPVEKKPWRGVINVTEERAACYQNGQSNSNASEDCLSINVFTPACSANSSLPVMFWIYGGGFVSGYASTSWYGPHHFMDKKVILVSVNYRIGAFGFLSFGDLVLPGNAGLKDQLLALQWTNKYIQYFGGDPKKITIFGQSAGAASVAHHLISPKSKGLFRAAICQSGTAISPWAYQRRLSYVSHTLARNINESAYAEHNSSSSTLLAYLQSQPADVIQTAANLIIPDMAVPDYIDIIDGFYFTPTIEQPHPGAFITESMYERLERGQFAKVNLMMGFTTLEWGFVRYNPNFGDIIEAFDTNIELVVPKDMNAKPENRMLAAQKIYNFYNQGKNFTINSTVLLEYFSDQGFTRSILKHADLVRKLVNVYFYQFSYKGVLSGVNESVRGFSDDVGHSEDLFYLFSGRYNNIDTKDWSNLNEMDRTTAERMTLFWTNFAKYGNPTPTEDEIVQNLIWPKYDCNSKYLDIGSSMEIRSYPKNAMYNIWKQVYSKWAVPPLITF